MDSVIVGEFTFSDLNNFLQNYITLNENNEEKLLYQETLNKINTQLNKQKQSICNLIQWDTIEKDVKFNQLVSVEGITYKITERQHKLALDWADHLGLNYKYVVRALSQNSSYSLQSMLNERTSVVDIITMYIDQPDLNTEWNQWLLNDPITRLKLVNYLIDSIESCVSNFQNLNGNDSHTNNNESLDQWVHEKNLNDLIYLSKMLKLISNLILNYNKGMDFNTVLSWFTKINKWLEFCQSDLILALPDVPFSILSQLMALININSILFLGFDSSLHSFNVNDSKFFNDSKKFIQLQNIIDNELSSNPSISYCWSCILFYKSIVLETLEDTQESTIDNSFLLDFNQEFPNVTLFTMSTYFAHRAENLNVFQSITNITLALKCDLMYPIIMTSFITFLLNFIPLNIETTKMIQSILLETPAQFVEEFLTNDVFTQKLSILKAKLPLVEEALLPFINLITTLTEFANFELKTLTTYAAKKKLDDMDYDLLDESNLYIVEGTPSPDDMKSPSIVSHDSLSSNASDLIVMKRETFIQPPFELNSQVMMAIPKHTRGQLLQINSTALTTTSNDKSINESETNETNTNLIIFSMKYNGWSLVGRILQNIATLYFNNGNNLDNVTKELMLAIIKLTSTIVDPSLIELERSQEILGAMSSQINVDNEDVISIIFKIYEIALNKRDYPVLVACSNFTNLLIGHYPNLVWSYLIRSTLLEKYGKTGLISTILGTIELPNGKYDFTINLTKLINLLIENTFTTDNKTPIRTKKDVIQKFTIHFIHVFENCQFWKFNDVNNKFTLCLNLSTFFSTVLNNVYGIDPESKPKDKITNVLAESCQIIIAFFLENQSTDSYTTKSLLSILTKYTEPEYSSYGNNAFEEEYNELIVSAFKLTNLFISIRNFLKLSPSVLEQNIFTKASTLVKLYIDNPSLKKPIVDLFIRLVTISWNDNYPFLLSYLGEDVAKDFLNIISKDLQSPLNDFKLLRDIYIFVGSLLQSKQDGLAVLFLTGNVISNSSVTDKKESKDNKDIKVTSDKSIINILKTNALKMNKYPEYVACNLLDCISFAFNSWLHSKNLKDDLKFIDTLLNKFNTFTPQSSPDITQDDIGLLIQQYRSIARIVEIFALYLYVCPQKSSNVYKLLDNKDLYSKIKPFFEYSKDEKHSQETLINRFNTTYPSYPLNKFRLTQLSTTNNKFQYGLFNMDLMNKLFKKSHQWIGSDEEPGLIHSVQEIASHMEYNHYKIMAAKAWGALITSYIKISGAPSEGFIDIVIRFLEINTQVESGKDSFSQLYHERIELIFYILYSFQKSGNHVSDEKLLEVLQLLIITFKSDEIDYLSNVATSLRKNGYRAIIRCVLIVLGLVQDPSKFVELAADQLLEIFEWAFSKGLYIIFHKILSDVSNSLNIQKELTLLMIEEKIQDVSLLLSLFAKIKSLNPPNHFNNILASSLYETGTIKVTLNLYSNAHLLTTDSEPLLGNIALKIISELCTIPEVADKFVRNGLYVVLLESPLSTIIQKGDVRPENNPRLHNIWSNGLLSIILLLLSTFGGKVLTETCVILNYFDKQVQYSISSWTDSKLAISTALVRETSQLIMLQKMLESLNYRRYLNDHGKRNTQIEEEPLGLIPGLDEDYERSELYVSLGNLLTHPKYLNSRIVAVTVEETDQLDNDSLRATFVNQINSDIKELQQSLITEL
ncbi:nucleoporin Nup188p [Monosporozyma unispora]